MGLSREELLDAKYWEDRYQGNQLGWDIGYPSTPLKEYFDQIENKNARILVPGAGNAYEAEYLFNNGFRDVSVIDLAPSALKNLKNRVPHFPNDKLIEGDFFNLSAEFDIIVEQTFFCALHPDLRVDYAKHMHKLLAKGGKLVGLFFNDVLNSEHPPYGGNKTEYLSYFEPYFEIKTFETAINSIEPRSDRELFAILIKR